MRRIPAAAPVALVAPEAEEEAGLVAPERMLPADRSGCRPADLSGCRPAVAAASGSVTAAPLCVTLAAAPGSSSVYRGSALSALLLRHLVKGYG